MYVYQILLTYQLHRNILCLPSKFLKMNINEHILYNRIFPHFLPEIFLYETKNGYTYTTNHNSEEYLFINHYKKSKETGKLESSGQFEIFLPTGNKMPYS